MTGPHDDLRDTAFLDEDVAKLVSEARLRERQGFTGQSALVINWRGGQPRGVEIVEVQAQKVLTFKRRSA